MNRVTRPPPRDPPSGPGALPELPVTAVLADLLGALRSPHLDGAGTAVLVAPPGTGKTTVVPLALLRAGLGRVVVAEPRRIAARAAAARMAHLSGGRVGGLVGYAVRGDRRVGPGTRLEVVTTGVLLRRLQNDPELAGVGVVVVDECHERHLDTDLVLGMLADVRATLRPDLAVLATSATAASEVFATALAGAGGPAAVVTATVPAFPLEVVYRPSPARLRPPFGLWVDPVLLDHVVAVTEEHLQARSDPGDGALVILPGAAEVDRVVSRLRSRLGAGTEVLPLHGRLTAQAQDAALRPAAGRRVVVATALAESSLTVPGVRLVVDAGLARRPRTDHSRGLSALVTVSASRAEAEQRAGRAHREGPGTVVRCWPEADTGRRAAYPPPEVEQADLTGFVLELACWGSPGGSGLALPSPPPEGAVAAATGTLTAIGALGPDGRVSPFGRRVAAVPAHPRLAAALLVMAPRVGSRVAAEVVTLLSDDGGRPPGDDLVPALRSARREATGTWRSTVRRLTELTGDVAGRLPDDVAAALVVGAAFPDRLARRRPSGGEYLMASGTAAALVPGSPLAGVPWLAVAVADRSPGRASATVRLAVATTEDVAREAGTGLLATTDEVRWKSGDVVARRVERLGGVVLGSAPLPRPDPMAVHEAVLEGLRAEGLSLLRWSDAAVLLRQRLAFLHRALGPPWPDVSDAGLLERAQAWLGPGLARARRRADLARIDVGAGLRSVVPWAQAARLDELAPQRIEVPSGSSVRVDYSGDQPVLAVRVQEVFGWDGPGALAGGRVPVVLHLLSPASRPAAVTADLSSFWTTGYPGMRADLRGRYPRHAWPQDPTAATPQRGVRRAR